MSAEVPTGSQPPTAERARKKFRMHWHVVLTHFPISAFLGAFVFTSLHLITRNDCYVQASYVSLVLGAGAMLPLTATGWFTWKRTYKGYKNRLFLTKIWLSAAMIVVSLGLVLYQTLHPFHVLDLANEPGHVFWLAGVFLLVTGAGVEGYYGGQLHHR